MKKPGHGAQCRGLFDEEGLGHRFDLMPWVAMQDGFPKVCVLLPSAETGCGGGRCFFSSMTHPS